MAKAAKAATTNPDSDLGSLPPELLVEGQASSPSPETPLPANGDATKLTLPADIVDEDDDDDGDSNNDEDDNESEEDPLTRHVVVMKGNTVRHNGENFGEFSKITMDSVDAERLIRLGVVGDLRTLREKAAAGGVSVVITGG